MSTSLSPTPGTVSGLNWLGYEPTLHLIECQKRTSQYSMKTQTTCSNVLNEVGSHTIVLYFHTAMVNIKKQ